MMALSVSVERALFFSYARNRNFDGSLTEWCDVGKPFRCHEQEKNHVLDETVEIKQVSCERLRDGDYKQDHLSTITSRVSEKLTFP